jgi:hypothetical protein
LEKIKAYVKVHKWLFSVLHSFEILPSSSNVPDEYLVRAGAVRTWWTLASVGKWWFIQIPANM